MENITEKKRMGEELDRHRNHLEALVVSRIAELAAASNATEAANPHQELLSGQPEP